MIYRKEVECTCCDRLAKFSLSFSLGTRSKVRLSVCQKRGGDYVYESRSQTFGTHPLYKSIGYLENLMTIAFTINSNLALLFIYQRISFNEH